MQCTRKGGILRPNQRRLLLKARRRQKWSTATLGRLIGVSPRTIRYWESGEIDAPPEALECWCAWLNVGLDLQLSIHLTELPEPESSDSPSPSASPTSSQDAQNDESTHTPIE